MVSTEYPPMKGGVGRYCKKLVDSLRKKDIEIIVISNEHGEGELNGISPYNADNSQVLLRLVNEIKPNLVHVQYEQGMYGIYLNPLNPGRTHTSIDLFYHECKVPIVSTFHSAYNFTQWMNLIVPLVNRRFGKVGTYLGMAYDYWTHLINYRSFSLLNKQKLGQRSFSVRWVNYYIMHFAIGIYHKYIVNEVSVFFANMGSHSVRAVSNTLFCTRGDFAQANIYFRGDCF